MNKLLLLFPALLMLTAGCGESKSLKRASVKHHTSPITIDTINIHGCEHEAIFYSHDGIMHSPECWCGKEETK